MEEIRFTISREDPGAVNTPGEVIWIHTLIPEDPGEYDLSQADEVEAFLQGLEPGTYSLDISVGLGMSDLSVCGCLFTAP